METQRTVCPTILCVVVKENDRKPLPELHGQGFGIPKNRIQVVGVTGVEPVTLRLSSACSNQLSYTPNRVGGAEETRTPDL